MKGVAAIFAREMQAYALAPMTYLVTAIFLLLSGAFFVAYLAGSAYADTSLAGFIDAARFSSSRCLPSASPCGWSPRSANRAPGNC